MHLTTFDRRFLWQLRIKAEAGRTAADTVELIARTLALGGLITLGRRYAVPDPAGDWAFTVVLSGPHAVTVRVGDKNVTITLARSRVAEGR